MKVNPWKIATFVLAVLLVISFIIPRQGGVVEDGVPSTGNDPAFGLTIVNDPGCKACDTSRVVAMIKAELFPTVQVEEVDFSSKKGKELIQEFGLNSLPAYIFDGKIEKTANYRQVSEALIKQGGDYLLNPAAVGAGKLIEEVQISKDDPTKGEKDAPVTIIEFTDFECPFCGKAANEALKDIDREYVKTGKVRLVFKDLPLPFHQNTMNAHIAARCAKEQGKFWKYHDKLFENQNALGVEDLKGYAKNLGLDTEKFSKCLDDKKYEEEVSKNAAYAGSLGIQGTPTFLINGVFVSGAQPFEAFREIIEADLE